MWSGVSVEGGCPCRQGQGERSVMGDGARPRGSEPGWRLGQREADPQPAAPVTTSQACNTLSVVIEKALRPHFSSPLSPLCPPFQLTSSRYLDTRGTKLCLPGTCIGSLLLGPTIQDLKGLRAPPGGHAGPGACQCKASRVWGDLVVPPSVLVEGSRPASRYPSLGGELS